MKDVDRMLIVRAVLGELGPEEEARLERRLAAEPGLREERDRLARVQALVRETPRAGFRPGFAARVAARIRAEAPRRLSAALALHFRRLAPAALAIILALLAHNLLTGGVAQSAIEAALGLEPVALEVAFELDPAGGAEGP